MPSGPVYWGSYTGETLEKVMAVLVAQEFPDVQRRTPSSGDGGVDLYRTIDGGYHITQVKGFTGRLDSSRQRQIEASLDLLTTNPRLSRPVAAAVFTAPIDLTENEQRWFEGLVSGRPFPCRWEGEVAWNSRAANHPHVIDYFFRDGRDRVTRSKDVLISAFTTAHTDNLTVDDVTGALEMMRKRLNREDPHYRYDFQITSEPPNLETPLPAGVVMVRATSRDDGSFVSVIVRPTHRYSAEDAPISGDVRLTLWDADRNFDIREEFDTFRRFGRGLTVPDGAMSVRMTAPGGLGGTAEFAGGFIGPRTPADLDPILERLRVRVLHPERGLAAELLLKTDSVTVGDEGAEIEATDDSGCFQIRMQIQFPGGGQSRGGACNFSMGGLSGNAIGDVIPAVRLVSSLAATHEVQICPQHGNRVLASGRPDEVPSVFTKEDVQFFDDLQTLQDHVGQRVVVPRHLTPEEVYALEQTARTLRGSVVVQEWSRITLGLAPDGDRQRVEETISSADGPLVMSGKGLLTLDGTDYQLGPSSQILHSVRLAAEQPDDGVALVPGTDNRLTFRTGEPPFEDGA